MRTLRHLRIAIVAGCAIAAALPALATPWVSRHNMTLAEYQVQFDKWTTDPYGYRLISVSGYEQGGTAKYAAVWEDRPGPGWRTHPQLLEAQFNGINANYALQGYRPVFISGFSLGNQTHYNVIWEHQPAAVVVSRVGLLHHQYLVEHSNQSALGYKLVHLWTFNVGDTEYFNAIWRQGETATYTFRTRRTSAQHQADFEALTGLGYQLETVSAAVVAGEPRYSSLWKTPGDGDHWYTYHGLTDANYQGETLNAYYQGYRTVFASSFVTPSGPGFNAIFRHNGGMSPANLKTIDDAMNGYLQDNDVAGLSLAISRQGQLVYAKGFGLADKSVGERMHPDHRLRIASISKPITAAGILKLRDHCGLDLDETVFGDGAILGTDFGTQDYSDNEKAITVRQLLHHTSGWTTDGIWQVSGDDPDVAIDWQLDNGDPTATPGTAYQYMNIGYAVLGRIIEKMSGKTYEQFIQDEILAPSCVSTMEIGGNTLDDRKPGEVVYYQDGKPGEPDADYDPYKRSPSRMDAHGGWIARPIDLLLFTRRIDGDSMKADLLKQLSWDQMHTGSTPNPNRGLGLNLGSDWWGHAGALPGTLCWLVYRTNDSLAFSIIINTRGINDWNASGMQTLVNDTIDTLDAAGAWPNYDLFPCDIPAGGPPAGMEDTRDWYVDWTSNCLNPLGWQDCIEFAGIDIWGPFPTVGQALEKACGGDRLFIRTGTYDEALIFDRAMVVRSYDGVSSVGE